MLGSAHAGVVPGSVLSQVIVGPVETLVAATLTKAVIGITAAHITDLADSGTHGGVGYNQGQARSLQQVDAAYLLAREPYTARDGGSIAEAHHQARAPRQVSGDAPRPHKRRRQRKRQYPQDDLGYDQRLPIAPPRFLMSQHDSLLSPSAT